MDTMNLVLLCEALYNYVIAYCVYLSKPLCKHKDKETAGMFLHACVVHVYYVHIWKQKEASALLLHIG